MLSNEARTPPANSSLVGALSKGGAFLAVGAHIVSHDFISSEINSYKLQLIFLVDKFLYLGINHQFNMHSAMLQSYYQSNMLYKILTAATHPSALAGWMVNSFPLASHTVVVAAPSSLVSQAHPGELR